MKSTTEAIVFDLGGVLIELGSFPIKQEWVPDQSIPDSVKASWLKMDIAQAFEKGEVSPAEFAEQLIREQALTVDKDEFIAHFSQWPIGPFPGVHDLLRSLQNNYTLAIYSNTNELHWDRLMNEMQLDGKFDHYFASHLIHQAKPAVSSFSWIANEMKQSPESIFFLDDSEANVVAAQEAGFQAEQVCGIDAVRECLVRRNLV